MADPSICIIGQGKSAHNLKGNRNWPPTPQFAQAAAFAHLVGLNGVFPNLDDLPMGHMTLAGCNPATLGPCVWTEPQQRSVFTLYAMFRSPIMFSGDMPTDDATLKIVTNTEVLAIQESSSGGHELSNVLGPNCTHAIAEYQCNEVVWAADDGAGGHYLAVFWTGGGNVTASVPLSKVHAGGAKVRDLWKQRDLPPLSAGGSLRVDLQGGDVGLFHLTGS